MDRLEFSPNVRVCRLIVRYGILIQSKNEFAKTFSPASLENDVLCLGDQERGLVGLDAKGDYERVIFEIPGNFRSNLDFIADALLLDRRRVGNKKNLESATP
jgi:hypothetical protein